MRKRQKKIISTFEDAINNGMLTIAKKDISVIFFGEGVLDPGHFFGTLKNLDKEIDNSRIYEMPISENGVMGIAIGSAMTGKRPIISLQRIEFALLALEQLFNNAAKAHYISNGLHKVPLVLRLVIGRGWGQGPEHSQVLENIFSSIPGLKVVMPAFPSDAKGMIISAVKDNNPIVFLEHRWCHYVRENVNQNYYETPISSGPKIVTKGKDLTLVATSYMTIVCLGLVNILSEYKIYIELIDLRVLRPLRLEKIIKSVNKTKRLLTVDSGFKEFGIGAEIVSSISENCFNNLKSAPLRLGLPNHPTPSSRGYIDSVYVSSIDIFKSISKLVDIDDDKRNKILKLLKSNLKKNNNDVPNPDFKGPF